MAKNKMVYMELVSHEIFGPDHPSITRLRKVDVCRTVVLKGPGAEPRYGEKTHSYYEPTPSSMRRTRQVMNKADWMAPAP